MPNALSSLERRILDFIVDYLRRNTYQPSIREIARRFGIKSTKTVSEYLQSLADKGWIERDPARSRGVRVIGLAMSGDTVSVPRYDRLTNKNESPVSALELDKTLVGSGGTYIVALGVDEDMPEGMQTGDLLIVEPPASGAVPVGFAPLDVTRAREQLGYAPRAVKDALGS